MIDLSYVARGVRISVETVVRLIATGWAFEQILESYADPGREDITPALEYAAVASHVQRTAP